MLPTYLTFVGHLGNVRFTMEGDEGCCTFGTLPGVGYSPDAHLGFGKGDIMM